MRSPSPTMIATLSRTSGRMSATRVPSARMICTACQPPAIEAITWRTRGSRPRAYSSISASSLALAARSTVPSGLRSV